VNFKFVIIATHVPLTGNTNLLSATLFQTKLAPYSSYVVSAKIPKGRYPEASYWDTDDPYFYLRIDAFKGFDYAILGGADHKTGQEPGPEKSYKEVQEQLMALIPEAKIDRYWMGQVIETSDGLPLIGALGENQFLATGFSGNGTTFGTLAGSMIRDEIMKQPNPWKDLYRPSRKKIKGSAWDYLKENKDYPYYMIRDRLAGSEGSSLRALSKGQGKILKLDGERVAAYRDDQGKVTKLSPVCTHMGCLVHWNGEERTWDCPCHGSRFSTNGDVITGPAEAPLPAIPAANK